MKKDYKESIYDLCYRYINVFHKNYVDSNLKKKVYRNFKEILDNGYSIQEIYKELNKYYKTNKNKVPNLKKLFRFKKKTNLLKSDETYYHQCLRIIPEPPTLNWDPISGNVNAEEYDFFFEPRASFTIKELAEYYESKEELTGDFFDCSRIQGGLTWLVNKYGIDLTLFMIDATSNIVREQGVFPPSSPLHIQNNLRYAKELYDSKVTNIISTTGSCVLPKKRDRR